MAAASYTVSTAGSSFGMFIFFADTRPDQLEGVAAHAANALLLLGARHKEIADMCRVANSPKLALRNALRPHVPPDGMLLFRNEFRWMRDMGPDADSEVMPNHFETASSEQLAEEFNYEILADYRHVIIVRPRRAR